MSAAEAGDVSGMVSLWGSQALQEQKLDTIRSSAQSLSDLVRKSRAAGEDLRVEKLRETVNGDRARVFFLYRDAKGQDSIHLGYALLKENGTWTLYRAIDSSEEAEPFEASFATKTNSNAHSDLSGGPTTVLPPPPPPPGNSNTNTNSTAVISGGALDNRAISLPAPPYPPVARAAKVLGTVVVEVTVDEGGFVIAAKAVSGHPLLRKAAEDAARAARLKPALVDGKPVKVKGTLTYEFTPQ